LAAARYDAVFSESAFLESHPSRCVLDKAVHASPDAGGSVLPERTPAGSKIPLQKRKNLAVFRNRPLFDPSPHVDLATDRTLVKPTGTSAQSLSAKCDICSDPHTHSFLMGGRVGKGYRLGQNHFDNGNKV